MWQISTSKIDKKNVLKEVNFTNLKTLSSYIAKSKPHGICLQLTKTQGSDYVIWPYIIKGLHIKQYNMRLNITLIT